MSTVKANRFNKDPKSSPFHTDFQSLIIEKLIMEEDGTYSEKKMEKLIRKMAKRPANSINLNTKKKVVLMCAIDLDLYLEVQDVVKLRMGEYCRMDLLIKKLLIDLVVRLKHKKKDYSRINLLYKIFGKFSLKPLAKFKK